MTEIVGSLGIELVLERETFDRDLKQLQSLKGGQIAFAATLDTRALRQQVNNLSQIKPVIGVQVAIANLNAVESQLKTLTRDRSVNLSINLNTNGLEQKLGTLGQNRTIGLAVSANFNPVESQLKTLTRDRSVNLSIALSDNGIEQKLERLTRDRTVRFAVELDNNGIDQKLAIYRNRSFTVSAKADVSGLDALDKRLAQVTNRTVNVSVQATGTGLNALDRQLQGFGDRTFKLSAIVDDSRLTDLNKHLDLKQRHWTETVNLFRSKPISPTVDDSGLTALNGQLDRTQKNLQDTSAAAAIPIAVQTDISQLLTAREQAQGFQSDLTNIQAFAGATIRLEAQHLVDTSNLQNVFQQATSEFSSTGKQIGEDISKQVSNSKVKVASSGAVFSPLTNIVGSLGQGISLAIGQKISAGFSQQANGFLEKIGAKSEQYVVSKAQSFERVAAKDFGYEGVEALRKDIARLGQFADGFIDPEKVRSAGQQFEQQLSKIAVDFFVNQKGAKQIFQEFSAENPLPRGASEAAFRVAGYGLQQVAPALRINKDVQLAKAAKQVEELVPTITIDPVRKREIERSNAVLYATGGLNNAGGKSGAQLLKPQLERIAPGAFIQPLSNEYRDSNAPLLSKTFEALLQKSGLQNAIPQDYLKFIDTGVFSGATPEVIRAAAEAKAYQQATNKPVYSVGYSAGGADVADLVRLGELTGTNIKGVGLGAPITGLTQRPSENFTSIQGGNDEIVRSLFTTFTPKEGRGAQPGDDFTERLKKSGLLGALVGNPIENTFVAPGVGTGHSLRDYLSAPIVQDKFQSLLPGILPDQLIPEYVGKKGRSALSFALDQSQKRPEKVFSAIQATRDRPPSEAGLDRSIEELRKYEKEYSDLKGKTTGSVKKEIELFTQSISKAIAAFEELKASGGSYTAQYRDLIAQSDAAKKEYQTAAKANLQSGKTAIFAKRDFKESIGVGGTKVQELVSSKQDSALANAQAIAKTVTVDTSEEFAQFQQKVAAIGAGLEPLLAQAQNIDILPTDEIVSLYEQISTQFNEEIDQLERLTDEFANEVERKPAKARSQVAEILPTLNRRKVLVPLAQEFGIENADKLKKKELIASLGQIEIGALQPKVLELSRNQAQQRVVRQERNAAIAQTAGNVARGTVEGTGTAIREVTEASKKAVSVFRIVANSDAAQAFIGGLGGATKGLFAIAKTGYKIASIAEGVALDALPFGRLTKGVLQQTALPAATFAAATHFLPGGQIASEGLSHLLSGAITPLTGAAGEAASASASGLIAQAIPQTATLFGHTVPNVLAPAATPITSAVTGAIQSLTASAGEMAVQAGTVILGGKLIQGTVGKAGEATLKAALPQDQPKALPAASNKALPSSSKAVDAPVLVPTKVLPAQSRSTQSGAAQTDLAPSFEQFTNPQLLAATRKLGIKGTNSKTTKDNLIERLKAFRNQPQVDQVLAQVQAEINRDGSPIAGFDKSAEKDALKRLSKAEKDINKRLAQLQTATGKKREKLINEILSSSQNEIAEIDQLKGQNLSGETLRSLSGTQGRIENTVRNNPSLNAARTERNDAIKTVTIEAQSTRVKGLARVALDDVEPVTATLGTTLKEGFRKLTNFAAKQFEVQPQQTIQGTLGAIAKSPRAIDLAVNTAGFAASQIGAKYGIVPELTGDLVGALVARQAITRGRSSGKDLTGDIAGFGVGNIAARSLNAGLDALTGVVPGAGVLRALPFKGAIAASLTVPKVQKAVEPFQEPPIEGLARAQAPTGARGLVERFRPLLPNNQKKAAQIRNNYEAIYEEIVKLSGAAYNPSNIPKLSVDGNRLKKLGAQAFFDIEQNTIVIDNTIAGILSKRTEQLHRYSEQLKSLTHEGRHSVQLDGGKIGLEEAASGQNVDLLRRDSLTQAQRSQVDKSVEIARRGGAKGTQLGAVKALETDAYAFEKNTGGILKNVADTPPVKASAQAAQKGLLNELGSAITGLKQRFQEGVGATEIFGLSLNKIGGFAKTAIAGFIGFQVLSNIVPIITNFGKESVNAAIKLDNLKTALSFGSGGAGNAAKDLAFIRGEATRLGVPLGALQEGFVKLSASTKGTALAGQVTKDLVTGLGQASTTLGLSAEESGGAILALSQIASKGKVQAEELRGQLGERIPGAFSIAARAMGATEAELNKFLETGSVTANDFLPKFARQLQVEFAGSAESASQNIQSSFNRLGNSSQQLQEKFGKLFTPNAFAVDGAAKGLDVLGNSLNVLVPTFLTFATIVGRPLLAPLAAQLLPVERIKAGLGALKEGALSVGGSARKLALDFGIATIATLGAIEAGRAIGEVFGLDEEGQKFKAFADQGEKSLQRIAKAARAARGEIDDVPNKPSESKGFDLSLGLLGLTGLDKTGASFKTDDVLNFANNINSGVNQFFGADKDFGRLTTVAELQQQKSQIEFNKGSDATNSLLSQIYSGQIDTVDEKGRRGTADIRESLAKAQGIDQQVSVLQAQRNGLAAKPKADKTRLGQLDEQIQALTSERAKATAPITELQSSIKQQIDGRKEQLKSAKTDAEKTRISSEIAALDKGQSVLSQIEKSFGTAADRVLDLKVALGEMNLKLEEVERNADIQFNIGTAKDLKAQIENFGSDVNASINAPVQAAGQEDKRATAKLEGNQKVIAEIQPKLNAAEIQNTLQGLTGSNGKQISLDSSVGDLQSVKTNDDGKKKLLDDLINYKKAVDGRNALEVEGSRTRIALQKAEESAKLAEIQKTTQQRESQLKRDANTAQIGLLEKQKAGSIYEADASAESANLQVTKGKAELDSTKQQLDGIEAAFAAGTLSAEEYEKQRREIGDRISDQEVQNAQNEVAAVKAAEAVKLAEIERSARKREAQIKQQESTATVGLIRQKIGKSISEEDAGIAQAQIGLNTANAQQSSTQSQLDELESAFARGIVKKEEYEKRSQDLSNSLADLSVRQAEQELALREAINRKIIEKFERTSKLVNASIDAQLSDRSINFKLGGLDSSSFVGLKTGIASATAERDAAQQRFDQLGKEDAEVTRLNTAQVVNRPVDPREQRKYEFFKDLGFDIDAPKPEQETVKVLSDKEAEDRKLQIAQNSRAQRDKIVELSAQIELKKIAQVAEAEQRSLNNKKTALETELKLTSAIADARQSSLKIGIDRTNENIDAVKALQSKETGKNLRAVLQQQLGGSGVSGSQPTDVLTLTQNRQSLELEADREKLAILERQQQLERESLTIQLELEKVSARKAINEAKYAQNAAQRNVLDAQKELRLAKKSGDAEEISSAQDYLANANKGLGISDEGLNIAQQQNNELDKRIAKEEKVQAVQQQTNRDALQAENAKNQRSREREQAQLQDQLGVGGGVTGGAGGASSSGLGGGVGASGGLTLSGNDITAYDNARRAFSQAITGNEFRGQEGQKEAILTALNLSSGREKEFLSLIASKSGFGDVADTATRLNQAVSAGGPRSIEVASAVNKAAFNGGDMLAALNRVSDRIEKLANTPRSLTFNSQTPIDDYADYTNRSAGSSLRNL
ncbi:MAG: tape measure protein [Myxacorys chilensis ATA2-1-KO14]|jgi:tape measure domain-containing protein|nr:tape measure protein [Myxacorys chilensis ATA2-1-KO14]